MGTRAILHAVGAALLLVRCAMAQEQVDARTATSERELLVASRAVASAQTSFDLKALDTWLAPDYVEASPIGDVDERSEVLGFYTPEAKAAMVASGIEPLSVTLIEPQVRLYGDHGIVITRQDTELKNKGVLQQRSFRTTQHFRKIDGKWRLQSAQFTPIKAEPSDERD